MTDKPSPDPMFETLLHHIQENRGLDFRGYKRTSLKRRITLRMEALNVEDFSTYQARLEADPGEFENLLNTVLINVTSFFRDKDAWEVLKTQVVPALIARSEPDRPIRSGVSAAPRARSPSRWPCCSPSNSASPTSANG
jgi:two-component system CheB/CheR fusion protein